MYKQRLHEIALRSQQLANAEDKARRAVEQAVNHFNYTLVLIFSLMYPVFGDIQFIHLYMITFVIHRQKK